MLQEIRDLINRKSEFVESAAIIFEDVIDTPVDELIILESDPLIEDIDDENMDMGAGDDLGDVSPEPLPTDDPLDEPVEGDVPTDPTPADPIAGDPAIGTDGPVVGGAGDELPTPIGAQTGEPPADDLNNILTASIDLQSNTFSDILPVPPKSAGSAIVDDILDSRVDSGFGDEPSEPVVAAEPSMSMADEILDSPVEPIEGETGGEMDMGDLGDMGDLSFENGTYDIMQRLLDADVTIESAKDHFKAVFGFVKMGKMLTEAGEEMLNKPLTTKTAITSDMLTESGNEFLKKHYAKFCKESAKISDFSDKIKLLIGYYKESISLAGDAGAAPPPPPADAGAAPAPAPPPPADPAPPPADPAPPVDAPPAEDIPPMDDLPPDDPAMALEDPMPEESEVTTAVRDKLAEADGPIEVSGNVRDDILDQLDKLNKEVLNAKERVKKALG